MPSTTTRSRRAKSSTKAEKPLPAALVKRARGAAAAKHKRDLARARALLALIARRKKEITEAFYDLGEALAELKTTDLIKALGRRTFAEVCSLDASISLTTAERLVEVATSMTREQALGMGQKKAMAMVALAAATPADDTAAGLFRKTSVALPRGKTISPRTASANAVEEAATAIRRDHAAASGRKGKGATGQPRGRTTTAEERAFAALVERRLHQLGLERARVTAVATKPGQGADLRFEHIPAAEVDALKKAIGR